QGGAVDADRRGAVGGRLPLHLHGLARRGAAAEPGRAVHRRQRHALPRDGRARSVGDRLLALPQREMTRATRIQNLPTPAVLIDLDVVERNVAAMQKRASASGVKLRPHAKTHKAPFIGRLQIAAGARGLTLAKVSEAEVFADAGFDDIFLGYPIVGVDKARRL